jgi:methylmalonyl-CoA/ethylmalonyl-CoA epimerase
MAVPSIDEFLEAGRSVYGGFIRRGPILNERQGVRELFLSDGNTAIELLEPLDGSSPVSGFLRRNPRGGLIHVAFDVDGLEPALAELEASGGRVIADPIPDVAFEERRIAFVLLGGQVIELIERRR